MGSSPVWNEEYKRELEIMWGNGLTATQIAKEFYKRFGERFTRNAVIGAAHRNNLPRKPSGRGAHKAKVDLPRKPRPKQAKRRPKMVIVKRIEYAPPPVGGVHFHKLESHHCRSVIGHGADGLAIYCGGQKQEGKSFCPDHCKLYYNKVPTLRPFTGFRNYARTAR